MCNLFVFLKKSSVLSTLLISACMSSAEQHVFDVQPATSGNPNDVNATYEIDIKRSEDTYSVFANYFVSDNQRDKLMDFFEEENLRGFHDLTAEENSNFIRCELYQTDNNAINVHTSVTISDVSGNTLYSYHHCVPHLSHSDHESLSLMLPPFKYFTLRRGKYKIHVQIKNGDHVIYPKYEKLQIEISNLYKRK